MAQEPIFKIDACYRTKEELAAFADQTEHMSAKTIEWLESGMGNAESPEFYRGLMAGYAGCHALAQQVPMTKYPPYIASIAAFLAKKLQKMEGENETGDSSSNQG